MDYLEGHLYHFRDNVSRDEVNAIIKFTNGEYGAIEIKLSDNGIIVGYYEGIVKDPETGIYIIPITSLKP